MKKLRENYFYETTEEVLEELELCREPVQELIRLTRQFIEIFSEKKRQKNIVDFTDMEHFALEILVKKEDGEIRYTQAADEFSDRFEEILIDEYQDSNLVQETLLQSVSQLRFGQHNLFMVGDVKQSIYRFRLARPELFMEKYETYSLEDSVCQRIDLHKNFRSRAGVLEGGNQIFYRIMGKDLGAVEYDADAALYAGAVFEEKPEGVPEEPACQVLVAQTGTDGMDEKMQEQSDQELEARMIGEKIRSMVGTELVWDKKEKQYRPARYQDCVILLRTITGWAENFVNVLMDMGIPAYATSKTGYFSTTEVQTILNYLRILDNPMQEIPFTGVLLSPLGGCSARELALLKACYPQEKIYGCVWNYLQEGQDGELCEKLGNFWSVYEKLREKVTYTPIHELIGEILAKTGYGLYAGAMLGGAQRRANLQMLVEKAMEYESTSYRGLFNFIRYVEQLQKYQVDFGEVNIRGEQEDTERIMSNHKSKGLEFPVVYLSGLEDGLFPSRMSIMSDDRTELEEERRLCYVGITRAKERLVITASRMRMINGETHYSKVSRFVDEIPEELIKSTKIFHFGTLSMTHDGVRAATKKAISIAEEANALISFDPNLRPPLWKSLDDAKEQVLYGLGHCHILKISDNEIQWLTGKEDYTDGVNWIRERYNIPLILVSMGKEGSRAYFEDKIVEVKPFLQKNTIETTGAGDTFCGCVLHYICEHGLDNLTEADLTSMLTFANAAAARITTRKGALRVMPDRAEIEKEIVSR